MVYVPKVITHRNVFRTLSTFRVNISLFFLFIVFSFSCASEQHKSDMYVLLHPERILSRENNPPVTSLTFHPILLCICGDFCRVGKITRHSNSVHAALNVTWGSSRCSKIFLGSQTHFNERIENYSYLYF